MALNTSNNTDLKDIIKNLKILGYGLDNWDTEFMKSILTTSSSSRKDLLFWILKLFGFQYSALEIRNFDTTVITKILNDLLSIGLCRLQDTNLIDGTASYKAQLKFWRTLINVALRSRNNYSNSEHSDLMLFNLVTSPYFEISLKEVNLNLIPEDLKAECKKFTAKIDLKDRISELNEEHSQEEKLVDLKVRTSSLSKDEAVKNLLKQMPALRLETESFMNAYESTLKPWCKLSSVPQENSSETGELASKCIQELKSFLQFVSLANDVNSSSGKIKEKILKLEILKQHNDASKLLQNTIND